MNCRLPSEMVCCVQSDVYWTAPSVTNSREADACACNEVRVNHRFDRTRNSLLISPCRVLVLAVRLPVARSGLVISHLPALSRLRIVALGKVWAGISKPSRMEHYDSKGLVT
jgi:hypothetical protein